MVTRYVQCPSHGRPAEQYCNGKEVVKEQRNTVYYPGLMCAKCISARFARSGGAASHETSARSVIEVPNPHHDEAAIVLADVPSQETLIRKVREHFTGCNTDAARVYGRTPAPLELPEPPDVMGVIESLARTRSFVHRPSAKTVKSTPLFLQLVPGPDTSLVYCVFSMMRITALRKRRTHNSKDCHHALQRAGSRTRK